MLENCTMLFRLALSVKVMFALQYILCSFKFLAKKISGNGSLIHKLHTKALSFYACHSERFRDLVTNVTGHAHWPLFHSREARWRLQFKLSLTWLGINKSFTEAESKSTAWKPGEAKNQTK